MRTYASHVLDLINQLETEGFDISDIDEARLRDCKKYVKDKGDESQALMWSNIGSTL